MLASHANEQAPAAAAALERLDAYEAAVALMLRRPNDEALYARSVEQFAAIRALTATTPGLRVRWIEVLISRFELLEVLSHAREGKVAEADLDRLHADHAASLQGFRRLCVRQAGSGGSR